MQDKTEIFLSVASFIAFFSLIVIHSLINDSLFAGVTNAAIPKIIIGVIIFGIAAFANFLVLLLIWERIKAMERGI